MRQELKTTTAASALLLVMLAAAPSLAQDTIISSPNSDIAQYQPEFFADYSPVTALDMVQRVPGFSLSDGDTSRRGLGDAFGNVFIDGARPANKALALETVLQRIPSANVVRIELIQEATPQFDMRGHARLINVVLTENTDNSGAWEVFSRMSPSGRVGPGFSLSRTTNHGDLEMTLALSGKVSGNNVHRRFARFDANNTLTEIQHDNDQRTDMELIPSIALNWTINENSSLRLNAEIQEWVWRRTVTSNIDAPSVGGLVPLRIEQSRTVDDNGGYKLGSLTYANELENGFSLETMLLVRREDTNGGPATYSTFDPTLGFTDAIIVADRGEFEETALRQTFAYNPNERHALEFGAEIAINSSDTALQLFADDGTTVTPIVLPVANTRVEETRNEIFANHVWTINDALSLESGLRYEFSEIVQTGDAEQSRSFSYPKPSITLNWRADEQSRIRLSARRDADQLRFDKFASSVDIADNNSVLGNPDYVPERTWTLEAEWERRFGDEGSVSLQIGHDWIEDLDGFITVTTPSGVFDAPGNIGDGTNLRVTGILSTSLDRLGIPNAMMDFTAYWYNTNIEDPLTGDDRHFDGYREWDFTFDFRQTFPAQQLAWGWDYYWTSDVEYFRAREYQLHDRTDGDLDIYLETTRLGDMTVRIGADELLNNGNDRTRIRYDGSRANGIIASTEHRNAGMGTTWHIQARGTF
jgi:hypothetical protein